MNCEKANQTETVLMPLKNQKRMYNRIKKTWVFLPEFH